MKHDNTLKGNPNKLTVHQHIHSKKSISKFANSNGLVNVFLKNNKRNFYVKPDNKVFCGKRVWSQKSETGFIKKIESNFHKELDTILKTETINNHEAINEYFLLWRIKHLLKDSDNQDIKLNLISASNISKEEEEIIELNGGTFIRNDSSVPSRFNNSFYLIMLFDKHYHNIKNRIWNIVKSCDGEFIEADCYNEYLFFPINPHIALIEKYPKSIIDRNELALLNRISINESQHYYFGRDLKNCPY